ncbi:MAG: hydroxyethylthiazole kinase [Candidatus Omnitrophica bacterium]|nr:hydroxyethylthiazole kinase [Candidatus Omnitrophota bacterium]
MNELIERFAGRLEEIRQRRPVVHNITNFVVMNFTANALLALGASPVMAHAPEEVEEMAALAQAVVLNIGTLSTPWIGSMFLAARAASAHSIPIVLDPVGAGATRFRTETARRMLQQLRPAIVRANASEILALAGEPTHTRGVDSADTVAAARSAALELARRNHVVVSLTGIEDYVTDGARTAAIANGHPLMGRVTGTGCVATALTGAFCAVEPDPWLAACGALIVIGIAGELAARTHRRPGSFQTGILDALDEIDRAILQTNARLTTALP